MQGSGSGYHNAVQKVRLIVMAGTASTKWKKLANRTKDRYYRFRELVTTEQDYKKDLISILENIQKPLLQSLIISQNDVAKMFPNVQSMIQLSVQLREELNAKFEKWDRRKTVIGQTMTRFSKFLLVYSDYFKNFNETQKKLKQILAENGGARLIEKKLSYDNRIVTFEDLMSKPFQRPLKYHLILRDYASKIEKSHPDYLPLQEAIECYHKVNQQNNLSLENKEKDQMLMILDSRFGNIIEAEARYFVKEYETIFIDNPYNLYILSDMVIISYKGTNNNIRVYFDKYSYVEHPPNGRSFVNRIFLYGKSICLHLTFFDAATSDEVFETLKKLIEDTNKNESNRQEIINLRTTRQSLIERRRSFTNLEPQFKRPLVLRVLGCEKRYLSSDKVVSFFIIQSHATPPKFDGPTPPHQISYVSLDTLLKIQSFGKVFYKEEQFSNIFPILSKTKDMTEYEYKKNETKRIQLQSLFIQLFLNSIYRNPKILKRIDFVSYLLKLSEPIWLHLNEKYICSCKSCTVHMPAYDTHLDYYKELDQRQYLQSKIQSSFNHKFVKKYFCDLRTIDMQQLLSSVPPSKLKEHKAGLRERIRWVKSKLGWVNHAFTTPKPQYKKLVISINLCNVQGSNEQSFEIFSSFRVRQVIELVSRKLCMQLQDYALVASINGKNYVLFDDQIIGDLISAPKEEGGFFSFFKSDDYPISLYLKKVWCLQLDLEVQQNDSKLILQVEEIIYRLKNEEIKLAIEQCIAIYAFYYAFKHFIELDTLTLNKLKMKNEEFSKFVAPGLKSTLFFEKIYQIIERLKQDKTLLTSRMITQRIVEFLSNKPGWNSFMFQGFLMGYNGKEEGMEVRIGCDIKGLKIQEKSRVSLLYDFKFDDPHWSCSINGFQLLVRQQQEKDIKEYCFVGRDLWKVKYQLDFYRIYRESFIKKA